MVHMVPYELSPSKGSDRLTPGFAALTVMCLLLPQAENLEKGGLAVHLLLPFPVKAP
jgi:hypothetical protein